jgi:uncharacterized protein
MGLKTVQAACQVKWDLWSRSKPAKPSVIRIFPPPYQFILTLDSVYQLKEFACALCGNCCRGEGFVRVRAHEIPRIAEYLRLSQEDFLATLCREPENAEHTAEGDTWLLDRPGPLQECIFLENNRCRINAVKPEQCLGFPLKWRTPDIMDYCVGMQT